MKILTKLLLVLPLLIVGFASQAQFADDFSDGNFTTNPVWQGDVNQFEVDEQFRLRLNADAAGTSTLLTESFIPDSTEWNIWFNLEFDPSTGNQLKIYLQLDGSDIATANGYFIQIGESGGNDALEVYRKEGTSSTLLARSAMPAVQSGDVLARLRVSRNAQNEWFFASDLSGGLVLIEEFSFVDDTYPGGSNGFFGVNCKYTSSRSKSFAFDDISIKAFTIDVLPPEILDLEVLSSTSLKLTFSEPIEAASGEALANFVVDQGVGQPTSSSLVSGNEVVLTFAQSFANEINYSMNVTGIADLKGNVIASQSISFIPMIPESMELGDLILNEILFNPESGGSDFVEIYNASDKLLTLDEVFIGNIEADNSSISGDYPSLLIEPGAYVVLTEDRADILFRYEVPNPDNVYEVDLPSFSNDDGNLSLLNNMMEVFESFNYDESFHNRLIDDVNGVSLERLSADLDASLEGSWHSASTLLRATPTGKNSQSTATTLSDDLLTISPDFKVFSPDNDGFKDFTLIQIAPPSEGYIGSVTIFDSRGRKVRDLISNEVLGANFTAQWDGLTDDNLPGDMGIYIVWAEAFSQEGVTLTAKETVVLARQL